MLEIVRLRDLFDEIENSRSVVHRCWAGLHVRVKRLFLRALSHSGNEAARIAVGVRRAQRPVDDGMEPRLNEIDTLSLGAKSGYQCSAYAANFSFSNQASYC